VNSRVLIRVNAGVILAIGLALLIPLALSLLYSDGSWASFLLPPTLIVAAGIVALQEELTLISAASAVAATLNVVGPGLGQVGTTESYEIVDPLGRLVLTVCMLLGGLGISTVVALLSPAFWKRKASGIRLQVFSGHRAESAGDIPTSWSGGSGKYSQQLIYSSR
jgi:hypothetical protein